MAFYDLSKVRTIEEITDVHYRYRELSHAHQAQVIAYIAMHFQE